MFKERGEQIQKAEIIIQSLLWQGSLGLVHAVLFLLSHRSSTKVAEKSEALTPENT